VRRGKRGQLPKRHGLSQEAVAEDQRRRLLDAVVEVVAEHGYSGAAVTDITRRAGVNKATFYARFDGKQECLLAACGERLEALLGDVERAVSKEPDWPTRVDTVLKRLLGRLSEQPHLARGCMIELPQAGGDAFTLHDRTIDRIGRLLAPAAGEMGVPLPPDVLHPLLGGGVWETVHSTLVRGCAADLPGIVPHLRSWALDLGRQPGA
jgi:AcrR family transcriptional regulator